LLLTQRGTPFIYYGEEIGMRDVIRRRSEIQDPPSRRYWPFFNRDGCRAPMQWDDSDYAGFSSSEPWMRVHSNYLTRNVAVQQALPDSLYNHFRRLIQLRKQMPALREGMTLPLIYEPRSLMAYLRKTSTDTLMVVLNFRRYGNRFALGGMLSGPQWELVNSSRGRPLELVKNRSIQLAGNEALILRQR
jgi:alpha-glucosidase